MYKYDLSFLGSKNDQNFTKNKLLSDLFKQKSIFENIGMA